MNVGNKFEIITAPKVSRDAVANLFGEQFAEVAIEYLSDKKRQSMVYGAMKNEKNTRGICLVDEITTEDYTRATEHFEK